jgi:DNA-binding NarL/FixJ family response regulator
MAPIRVLIADDHPFFRDGLRTLFNSAPETEVVGEAASGDDVIARAAELRPDVILMDIQMPGANGIEATRRILADNPEVGILVVTMFEDDDSVFAAMRAGARGYLLKGADHEEMLRAVRAVTEGEAIFGPAIARRLTGFFVATTPDPEPVFPALSEREREILDLIAQGRSNTEIAHHLYLAPKTVRNYVSSVFTKLQVADRAKAIVLARDAGLGRRD